MGKELYKICLENSGNLIEKRIPESKGSCLIGSVYQYSEDGSEGIFAVRKTKEEAINALKEAMTKEITYKEADLNNLKKKLEKLTKTVTYNTDSEMFVFGWKNRNIILQKEKHQVCNGKVSCYSYEFKQSIENDFIRSLNFPDDEIENANRKFFIKKAVDNLDTDISLPFYKIVIYSETMSELTREMLKYLDMFAQPELIKLESIDSMELELLADKKILIIDEFRNLNNTMFQALNLIKKVTALNNIVIFSLIKEI